MSLYLIQWNTRLIEPPILSLNLSHRNSFLSLVILVFPSSHSPILALTFTTTRRPR